MYALNSDVNQQRRNQPTKQMSSLWYDLCVFVLFESVFISVSGVHFEISDKVSPILSRSCWPIIAGALSCKQKLVKWVSAAIQFNSHIHYYLQPRFIAGLVSWILCTWFPCRKFNLNGDCLSLEITNTKCHIKSLQLFLTLFAVEWRPPTKSISLGGDSPVHAHTHTSPGKGTIHEANPQA